MTSSSSPRSKKLLLGLLLLLPITVYLTSLLISGEVNFRTLEVMGPGPGTSDHALSHWSLVDYNGEPVTEKDLQGKVVIVSFFFTSCPTICPAMNNNLREAHNRLSSFKDVVFVSFSVDPETDTPEVLKKYAEELGVATSEKWIFLTGPRDSIYALANAYFLVAQQDAAAEGGYTHSQSAVLVDWNGVLRSRVVEDTKMLQGSYDLTSPHHVDELVDDIRVLAKEFRKVKMEKKETLEE